MTNLMNKYKLKASIHTLSLKSNGVAANIDEDVATCIRSSTQMRKAEAETLSTINPNKLRGDLFSYSEFVQVMNTILTGAGIKDHRLVRADMRFDSYDPEHYVMFKKLNRLLISMLAVTYNVRNCYKTDDLFSQRQLSVAIKNDYFEIENYDRAAKTEQTQNHIEPAKARLEERTMARGFKCYYGEPESIEKNCEILKEEFLVGWLDRWDKAILNIDKVYKRYNDELERIYNENKNNRSVDFRTLTDFIIHYKDCIFTKTQLIELLSRFEEVNDPNERATNLIKKYRPELFSENEVQQAIAEVKRATVEFFEN